METHENPEQIQFRPVMYAKFARTLAIAEKNLIIAKPEPISPADVYSESWRNKDNEEAWTNEQLGYIHEYTDEYETRAQTSSSDTISSKAHESYNSKQGDVIGIRFELNSLRGSDRKILYNSSTHESTASNGEQSAQIPYQPAAPSDRVLDKVSTQMPATEYLPTDYQSNVSSRDLKMTYFKDYKIVNNLPIYQHRTQIINSIICYNVVIIEGATGCGKTTQVPMYILEDAILENPSDKAPVIYVTQPSQIAARSIAERICNEHNWPIPSVVGYQFDHEEQVGPHSVLVFCTAGVLLQKIIQEKSLTSYTHIIIDEAHERDADTDLLLMMIRKLMVTVTIPNFRLIVMSATIKTVKLRNYFSFKTRSGTVQNTSPCFIKVGQDKEPNNIHIVYLDKLNVSFGVNMAIPEFDMENPELYEDCLKAAVELITKVVPRLDNNNEKPKSTLVFLPDLEDISRLDQMIRAQPGAVGFFDIIPLHSCLTEQITEQIKVSEPARRKVILATNIAESSITLTDVGFVVDFCLTKIIMRDNTTRFPILKLIWSTREKSTQRAGRTGRCCPGKVFRMVPVDFYKTFRPFAEPGLLTAPLEQSVLRVKNFQMGEIKAMFAIALDPPPSNELRSAVSELKRTGALAATYKGHLSDIDGDLTELGRIMSALPIDVHLSKLIVVASVLDVLEDAIIVAAFLSTNRTATRYMYENSISTYNIKLQWERGSHSDLLVILNCYKAFKELKDERGKADRLLASWCDKNHLDEREFHNVDSMVTEIIARLRNFNIFTDIDRPSRERDEDMDNLMLKIAFCAAFYPNYFLTDKLDGRDAHELYELEVRERDQRDENQLDHHIFKSTYKRVRGPDSPIRMSFRSVLTKSVGFNVEIDGQSVNSILLDPEYEKDRRQMLVAAAVTQTKNGRVMARDTTLMPNIRGMPTLMALLFSRYYRLVYNTRTDAIAGAIFGIDVYSEGQNLDCIGFDIHVTPYDIALINSARRFMSQLLKFTEIHNAGLPQAKMQSDLRKIIMELMQRPRFPLPELDVSMIENGQKLFEPDTNNLLTDISDDYGDDQPLFPPIICTRQSLESDLYWKIRGNLGQMRRILSDEEDMPWAGIYCLACGNGRRCHFYWTQPLLKHIGSQEHLKRVTEFELFFEKSKVKFYRQKVLTTLKRNYANHK